MRHPGHPGGRTLLLRGRRVTRPRRGGREEAGGTTRKRRARIMERNERNAGTRGAERDHREAPGARSAQGMERSQAHHSLRTWWQRVGCCVREPTGLPCPPFVSIMRVDRLCSLRCAAQQMQARQNMERKRRSELTAEGSWQQRNPANSSRSRDSVKTNVLMLLMGLR